MNEAGQLVIFEAENGPVQVRLEGETVWLTQAQMAELFGTTSDNISPPLKNIYKERELQEAATTEAFSVVRQEGARQVRRRLKHYNLDAIISVGYRVSSAKATRFRQWAATVLCEHLTRGFTLKRGRFGENAALLSNVDQEERPAGGPLNVGCPSPISWTSCKHAGCMWMIVRRRWIIWSGWVTAA